MSRSARCWPVAVLLLAGAMPGQEAEEKPWFAVQTSGSIAPGQEAKVSVQATKIRSLEFRLYKVNDIERFFLGLPDPHRFGGGWRKSAAARTPLEKFARWKRRWWARLRDVARAQYTPEQRAEIRMRREMKKPPEQREQYVPGTPLNPQQLVRSWDVAIRAKERWTNVVEPVRIERKGLYVLEATDGEQTATTIISVTDLALVVKGAPGRLLAWTVNRETGEPAAGVNVKVFDTRSRAVLFEKAAGAGGEAEAAIEGAAEEGVIVMARRGEDVALATGSGYSIGGEAGERLQGVVYTDRPVYRPAHVVRYRAIVRQAATEGYRLPEGRVRAEITDSSGNVVTRKEGKVSEYGTFSGDWTVPQGAPLGYYSIRVGPEDAKSRWAGVYGSFNVEEYRKPDFEVRVTAAERRVTQGGSASFVIDARYFYGEPVPGGKVTYTVRSRRAWLPWMIEEDEPLGDAGEDETWSGEAEVEKQGVLDQEGRLKVDVPLRKARFDLRYTVEARVRDSSGRTYEGRGSLLATVGPFFLPVEPELYVVAPGKDAGVTVTARDYDGKALAGVEVTLKLAEYRWREGKSAEMPSIWSAKTKTGADGRAQVRAPLPGGGAWMLTAEASAGAATVSSGTVLWAEGAGMQSGQGVIRIVPDRKKYAPGDTVRLLIVPGAKTPRIWVSVEGRNLYRHAFVDVSRGSGVYEFKVEDQHTPNVFVECVFVAGNTVHQGSKMVKVPPAHKTLAVELKPSKAQYKPGETAAYSITAKDYQGRPARAAFSLGVVDEAIYALYRDPLPDLVEPFYGRQWNRIQTETSLEYYFYGEAGKRRMTLASAAQKKLARGQLKPERLAQPKIRKEFPDTAFWVADVETSDAGQARVEFSYPDSLTAWRATARGVTVDTKVGQAVERAVVRKDLLVMPALPRFLTEGDTVRAPMLVRNYTGSAKSAEVSVTGQGVSVVAGASGRVEAAARGEGRLDSVLRAGPVREAKLLVKALSTDDSDAVELTIPVEPAGLERKVAVPLNRAAGASGALFARHTFPERADAAWRQVVVRITPSVAGALFEGLEYLTEYPYGCTEQTMSSLLPNLAAAQAAEKLGLKGLIDKEGLGKRITAGLDRLKRMQQDNGGWGWWSGGDTDAYLTAYVMWGLHLARSAGYPTGVEFHRGRARMQAMFDRDRDAQPDTRAMMLYVLALDKAAAPARIERVISEKSKLSAVGLAFLGLALRETGDKRSAAMARELAGMAVVEGSLAHWPVDPGRRWDFPTEGTTEATAMAAKLIAAETPESPLINKAAAWLLAKRSRGYYWTNTKTTAFAILGLTDALARSGEMIPDGTVTILVNGKEVWLKSWNAADAMRRPDSVTVALDARQGEHVVEIRKVGGSPVNASVEWSWREQDAVADSAGGLSISRSYYRLVPSQGGGKLTYGLEPLSGPLHVGDVVAVSLRVNSASRQRFLVIEDRLPTGAEALEGFEGYDLRGRPEWWSGWFDRRELGDSRVRWYPQFMWTNGGAYTYLMRFTNAGLFRVAPARIETMYDATAQAWSDSVTLEVQP